jgi:endonuclease-3
MDKDLSAILRAMQSLVDRPAVVSSKDPFRVLISTVLSQRTRDENTARASKQLFAKYKVAAEIARAPLKEVEKLVRPAGFYRVKAAHIKGISKEIEARFGGAVPNDLGQLVSLPGVGRKTANCVLVYGFGKPALPVDVHVHRLSNRIGLVKTKTPKETELALMETVPKRNWFNLNHLMVRYGQKVCLPRKPKCEICKIRPECDYFNAVVPRSTFK